MNTTNSTTNNSIFLFESPKLKKSTLTELFFYVLIGSIILLAYLIKETFIGLDSYFYLNIIFGNLANTETGLVNILFTALPKNIYLLKTILVSIMIINMVILSQIGKTIFGKNGWVLGFLVLINPVFLFESLKLEEEQFIYPIIFFVYLIGIKLIYYKKIMNWIIGIPIIWIGFTFVYLFWIDDAQGIPWMGSLEYIPLSTTITCFFATLGMAGFLLDKKLRKLIIPATLLTFLGIILPKFGMLSVPLLAIGFFQVIVSLLKKWEIDFEGIQKNILLFALLVSLFSFFFFGIQTVTIAQNNASIDAVELSNTTGLPIKNDWGYGYLVFWNGGKTYQYAGGTLLNDYNNSIAITRVKLNDCLLYSNYGENFVQLCYTEKEENFSPINVSYINIDSNGLILSIEKYSGRNMNEINKKRKSCS